MNHFSPEKSNISHLRSHSTPEKYIIPHQKHPLLCTISNPKFHYVTPDTIHNSTAENPLLQTKYNPWFHGRKIPISTPEIIHYFSPKIIHYSSPEMIPYFTQKNCSWHILLLISERAGRSEIVPYEGLSHDLKIALGKIKFEKANLSGMCGSTKTVVINHGDTFEIVSRFCRRDFIRCLMRLISSGRCCVPES